MSEFFNQAPALQSIALIALCVLGGVILRWFSGTVIRRICGRGNSVDGDELARFAGRAIVWCSLFIGIDVFLPASLIAPPLQPLLHPILLSLCIVVFATAVAHAVGSVVHGVSQRRGNNVGTASLFQKSLQFAVYLLALILIFDAFGIKVTTFIATLGIGGLALALALQDTLTNLFAGMYITVAHQIRVGDVVSFDAHEGTVTDIGWRTTLIRKADESIVIAPNSKLSQTLVTVQHFDAASYRGRIVIQLGIDEDVALAESTLHEIVDEWTRTEDASTDSSKTHSSLAIFANPKPLIRIGDIKDGAVELVITLSVASPARFAELRSALILIIHSRFAAASLRLHNPYRRSQ